jgi:hypothetical protein
MVGMEWQTDPKQQDDGQQRLQAEEGSRGESDARAKRNVTAAKPPKSKPLPISFLLLYLPLVAPPDFIFAPWPEAPTLKMATRPSQPLAPTSEKATAAFIRRTLAPHLAHPDQTTSSNATSPSAPAGGRTATPKPITELLPPLTSSNEVDLQLYGILAVIIKDSIQTWYAKITPDRSFVDEVIQTIAHCTRALEQRIRRMDVVGLIGDEVAGVVEAHYACEYAVFGSGWM